MMGTIRFPVRRRTAAAFCAPGVVGRQAWIALLMGLIAVAALRSLWSSHDMRPSASRLSRPLPTVESAFDAMRIESIDGVRGGDQPAG
jgi:hypothetical protein